MNLILLARPRPFSHASAPAARTLPPRARPAACSVLAVAASSSYLAARTRIKGFKLRKTWAPAKSEGIPGRLDEILSYHDQNQHDQNQHRLFVVMTGMYPTGLRLTKIMVSHESSYLPPKCIKLPLENGCGQYQPWMHAESYCHMSYHGSLLCVLHAVYIHAA